MIHDPKVTTERLEAEGFAVSRQEDGGYRVVDTIDGKQIAFPLPDAEALYWFWLGSWIGCHRVSATA